MLAPIVAGTDGSEESLAAVEWAAVEAVRRRLPLRIVHVLEHHHAPAAARAQLLSHDVMAGWFRQDPRHRARSALARARRRAAMAAPGVDLGAAALAASEVGGVVFRGSSRCPAEGASNARVRGVRVSGCQSRCGLRLPLRRR